MTPANNRCWEHLWTPKAPVHAVRSTYRDVNLPRWLRLQDLSPSKGRGLAVRLITSYKLVFEIVAVHYGYRSGRSTTKVFMTTVLLKPHVTGIHAFTYPHACLEEWPDYYRPLLAGAEEWARDHISID